jgi:Flp pilus assembly protein TadG
MRIKRKKLERGQSLVELSLSLVFFLVIFLGVLDLGRAYYTYVALEDSAGEAAIFLAINPSCAEPNTADCANPNNARYRAENAADEYFDWSKAEIDIKYVTGDYGVGNTVGVEIRYPFTLYTPIISSIVGSDGLTITAYATQTIMVE